MARNKIIKEGGKVGSIRGAVAKAKKDSSCRKVYFLAREYQSEEIQDP